MQLTNIEKRNSYLPEPYLSDATFNLHLWRPDLKQIINVNLSKLEEPDNESKTSEEDDSTIQNFILFDDSKGRKVLLSRLLWPLSTYVEALSFRL